MTADSKPVSLAVRLPFKSPEEFLARYGVNLTRGGIYLRAKSLKPPGTAVVLEIKLENGQRVLFANAVVSWVTGNTGEGVSGMGFKFITLDAPSRRFLESAAATMPHAKATEPPIPRKVGPIDSRPEAVEYEEVARSQLNPMLPSEETGQLVVHTAAAEVKAPAFEPVPLTEPSGPIIGIDLGTTNSSAAIVPTGGEPTMLRVDGQSLVPSMVALSPREKLVVGAAAKAQLVSTPRWTVYGFKRLIGRPADSPGVRELLHRFPYEVVPSPNGQCAVKLADRVYSLEELSALVLREVKELAEHRLEVPVNRAVITVPAWYTENQRESVREAGRLAGLHVERIVNEPTAAALFWGHTRRRPHRVLVYDFGGGTFDASVLELNDSVYEVVSTGGDTFLGGIDFDSVIVAAWLEEFANKSGVQITDRVAVQRLLDAAERAKIALSDRTETTVQVPFIASVNGAPADFDITFTRAQLEKLTRPLVDRTMEVCQEVLHARNLRADQIDEVVLVGGQSRAPLVQDRISVMFGRKPVSGGNPEESVSLGAALLADSLERKAGLLLIDVLGMSIGVGLPGGRFHPVIPRNTSLPVKRTFPVSTTRQDQRSIEITVFQGESPKVKNNSFLGTFTVPDLPKGPRGSVQLEVTFELSNECLLTLTAKEVGSGRSVSSSFATRDTPQEIRERIEALEADVPTDEHEVPGQGGLIGWVKRLFSGT